MAVKRYIFWLDTLFKQIFELLHDIRKYYATKILSSMKYLTLKEDKNKYLDYSTLFIKLYLIKKKVVRI